MAMFQLMLILVLTTGTRTVGETGAKVPVPNDIPEMLRAMLGGPDLARRSTRNSFVPEAMMSLYAAHKVPDKTIVHGASIVRSFTHNDRNDIPGSPHSDAFKLLWFNMTTIPETEVLQRAYLELHREPLYDENKNNRVYIHIHDVVRRWPPVTRLIDTRAVSTKGSDKIILDVEPAVHRWLAEPASNHGLVIEIAAKNTTAAINHVRLRRSTQDAESTWLSQQPVLMAYMDDPRARRPSPPPSRARKKRHLKRKHSRRHCRRHSMYVDFAAVGWDDWIVTPPGYEAYYCHGDCAYPIADHMNATNHAIVQTLQNSADPRAVPKPCCVPTTLGPISMLYTDSDDKTVLKVYQDMVVLGCGCR